MATQSSSASTGVGSSSAPTIVEILQTNRNPTVWCNFNLVKLSDGSIKANCKHCGNFFKSDSNSTLRSHTDKYCQGLKSVPEAGQASMSREGGIFAYSADRCREEFACFVIQDALPFNHFDNPRLTKVIQNTLQPRYNQVSRATLRRDCIKIWKKAKIELLKGFENLNTSVNLTTDVWSAPHGLPGSYLCVTAHWVDPVTWQMMKRTIAFENFEYPHTGENLFHMLRDVINNFKLENKVFSISFDNATNNTNAVQKLILKYKPPLKGIFYHSRCVAHIINLVVQDGLAVWEITYTKTAFKNMLQDIFCSGKTRYKQYMKLCKDTDNIFLTPNWDVPTRWNSTYKMFLCGLRQKDTLQLFHDHLVASNNGRVTSFSNDNWDVIKNITELLKVFKSATTLLSGVYYPTSHLVLNQIFLMCSKLDDYESMGGYYEKMVAPMKLKLRKYFKEMPPIITCAAALNPCLNVSGVELLLDKISSDLDLHEENVFFARDAKDHFNKCFKDLFGVYFNKYGSTNVSSTSDSSSYFTYNSMDPMLNLYNSLREENNKRARGDGDGPSTSELGRYKGTDFLATMGPQEFANFDILAWWKGRESQFPVLTAMARDVLTVQASTVASESAFSLSGRVLSIRRTRLTPASLEMCICLKDHLDAAERIQDKSSLEGELEIEQEIHDVEVEAGFTISLSDEEIALDEASREASSEDDIELDEDNI